MKLLPQGGSVFTWPIFHYYLRVPALEQILDGHAAILDLIAFRS